MNINTKLHKSQALNLSSQMSERKLPAYECLRLNLSLKFASFVFIHQPSFQSVFSFNQPCRDLFSADTGFFCLFGCVALRNNIWTGTIAECGSHLTVIFFTAVVKKVIMKRVSSRKHQLVYFSLLSF